ncbi:phosphoadenylyl-sulfate reductase [Ralstonia pseudosolanacearum]|uniref:Adenosine 5'-phosphosulfate reductase n=1 Tax=Ralstonia solanacearum TaxID=305 RepID=A0AA92Q530_RALSL|nr:phosphoadenylyl-sulfate reductase [Ralstonia pseudosolanacearum]QOK90946.1 phosphoadenylyl-sulfate reductase [Ralstonia pseudosolanacearum]QOK95864.1 phosphoadenylyl-sulfate reductase [Ralstonia pseudosolanacearum]UWD91899.1 phosphoadenylyl-sulfate reductase [Ralstonia pseudosolanacearum]CAH0440413.1 Thioredoxin-dependent 5'-adenylylsulfate reductase [Ralstonia pseudosolanacearum]
MSAFQEAAVSEVPVSAIGRPVLWSRPVYTGTPEGLAAKEAALFERLAEIAAKHGAAKFASSLAAEDMVVTDAILRSPEAVRAHLPIFTLQTGRLHAETLTMLERIREHYGYAIEQFAPDARAVEAYVRDHGLNAFYDSIELRKACCTIRKVVPLNRALRDADAWLTGQRREQAVTRADLPFVEEDDTRGIAKYNPLFDWTEAEVWAYLERHAVPVNALHDKGYPSIGCEPCTRAVRAGEDVRAGRWWWESRDSKECGLHATNVSHKS